MAGDFIITGGRPLSGTVRIPAAKNSVLPLLAATILCSGPVRLRNVPPLADVDTSLRLLRGAGGAACRQGGDVLVERAPTTCRLDAEAAAQMRASILFCAPLLARLGRAETVLPGGCRIGARPVDLHLSGLKALGAQCREEGERLILTAPSGLRGADITLRFPSVGATETLLLAAATAPPCAGPRGSRRSPTWQRFSAAAGPASGARAPAPSGWKGGVPLQAAPLHPWRTASWRLPTPAPARRQAGGWN